jgi:hypothetical protein
VRKAARHVLNWSYELCCVSLQPQRWPALLLSPRLFRPLRPPTGIITFITSLRSRQSSPRNLRLPPPASGTSGAAGAAAFGGFIAFVGVLAGYDLLRRTTCIGDPWRLGGPGFTEKMPNGNVMIPQCPVKRVAVVKARG